jgi:hypothetical protein
MFLCAGVGSEEDEDVLGVDITFVEGLEDIYYIFFRRTSQESFLVGVKDRVLAKWALGFVDPINT